MPLDFFENRLGSDGRGSYYPYKLNSGKDIALRINSDERNKYIPGDCLRIIRDKYKYPYEDKEIPVYKIKEK